MNMSQYENPLEKKKTFTVKTQPRIISIEESKKISKKTSICLAVIKWISTIFLFSLTSFCLVTSKISLIAIAGRLNPGTFSRNLTLIDDNCGKKDCSSDIAFVMVILTMVIPEVISFFRAFQRSIFSSKELWPKKSAVAIGVVGAILESLGLSMFTVVLISTTQHFTRSILYMNGIFIFGIVSFIFTELRKLCTTNDDNTVRVDDSYIPYGSEAALRRAPNRSNRIKKLSLFVVSSLCAIGGFVFTMIQVKSNINVFIFPVSILCLSIAWSPKMFKLQTIVKNELRMDTTDSDEDLQSLRIHNARHKMTLISSLIKIILYFLIPFLLAYVFNSTSTRNPGLSFKNGFEHFSKDPVLLRTFITQIFTGMLGYICAWLACTMNLQKICFVFPLLLSTPLSIAVITIPKLCQTVFNIECEKGEDELLYTIALGCLLWLSQVLSFNIYFYKSQQFLMASEDLLFWFPTYNGCLLEQQLLVNRKNEFTDENFINYREVVKESHIYVCTTMYHEADYEMEQLLRSLAKIDEARKECGRQFEAHVFMDDGVRGEVVKWYALQLLSLVKETLGIDPGNAFKLETPYGLQMKWLCPNGMPFILHLKDKVKVKAKKRWSQVMYMSYVLDFKETKARDDMTYILATDADVKFEAKDVMALMDYMSRSANVGAVCGRTHPMGSGPMVWYQIFDYAVGHWLLKVANHVFGSVLCAPGCFSVYRAKAIRNVLPLYASGVDCAMDFLMKDMGEDRWFCTLLVESGWKLEYCATAIDSTYCPDTFEEFFKQRRRWGPSTLANSAVVLDKQKSIRENNDAVTFFFIVYQAVLLLSTIIGPSTVLLVISGGLQYAFPESINLIVVLVLLIIISVLFTIVCLYCKQDTQLKAAKWLTFFFAIIMSITIVGIILQTVDDVSSYVSPPTVAPPTTPRQWGNVTAKPLNYTTKYVMNPYIFSPATWYLLTLTSVFIISAFLHGLEGFYLIHGIWYLLCLPSGYLLLTIYSVANLTDRSWGTREGKTVSETADLSLGEQMSKWFHFFCWCCVPPNLRKTDGKDEIREVQKGGASEDSGVKSGEESVESQTDSDTSDCEDARILDFSENISEDPVGEETTASVRQAPPIKSALKKPGKSNLKRHASSDSVDHTDGHPITRFRFPGQEKSVHFALGRPRLHACTTVKEWLSASAPSEYLTYVDNFIQHGYDNISFIAGGGLKEKDLINIGVSNRGHRKKLMMLIDSLPPEDLFQDVPENVEDWLINLGLEEYWPIFIANSYTEPRDLADIKYMNREDVSTLFEISKEGHLKRLLSATSVLQYPTKAQKQIRETRKAVMHESPKSLELDNADDGAEFEFWEELREICLLPEQAAFNQSGELVEKLGDMRDTCLLMLTVSNVLWLTFMVTIIEQGKKLSVLGSPFASVAFLMVYGLVLILQFVALLWHRLETLVHFIARAPFKPGHLKSNWAWRDEDLPPSPDPEILEEIRRRRRRLGSASSNGSSDDGLNAPLL